MLNILITTNINKFNANEGNQVLNLLNSNTQEHHSGDYIQTFIIGLNLLPCPEGSFEEVIHTPEFQAHYDQFERVELNFIRNLIHDLDILSGHTLTVNEELPIPIS